MKGINFLGSSWVSFGNPSWEELKKQFFTEEDVAEIERRIDSINTSELWLVQKKEERSE